MDIWQQVEQKARLAAVTSATLGRWVGAFLTFPHTEIRDPQALAFGLTQTDDQSVLRLLREETAVLVAFLRLEIEMEREQKAVQTS